MSLQIKKRSEIYLAMALTLAVIVILASLVYADSGAYKTTKHADPQIGVNRDSNLPRGNCSQCHLEHNTDNPNDYALFAPPDNSLCLSSGCHEYEYQWPPGNYYWSYPGNVPDWYNSAHGSSTALFTPGGNREVRLCVQCHNPHGKTDSTYGVYPSETSFLEEGGCYSNGGLIGQGCHGNNSSNRPIGAADIYSEILKSSRHNVEATAKEHSTDWIAVYPYGRESRTPVSGFFAGDRRHVECVDCHNPHKAIAGTHQPATGEIGGPLLGNWGVEPGSSAPWTVPMSFNAVDFSSISTAREYQLCLKCHSYFAYGYSPPTGYTDIAREINPANASFHPIEDTVRTNSYTTPSPNNNFTETMETPWDDGRHNQMTCSDCHGSENGADPKGPHGSNQPYILMASPAAGETALCLKCHKASVYAPPFDPGAQETGSRFDLQTTGNDKANHYYHVTIMRLGCRQCHAARQTAPPAIPEQRTPYPIQVGSAHGTNLFAGLLNGTNISSYSPGSCTPTCHDPVTYNAGPE
jgi:hypothetical protein